MICKTFNCPERNFSREAGVKSQYNFILILLADEAWIIFLLGFGMHSDAL